MSVLCCLTESTAAVILTVAIHHQSAQEGIPMHSCLPCTQRICVTHRPTHSAELDVPPSHPLLSIQDPAPGIDDSCQEVVVRRLLVSGTRDRKIEKVWGRAWLRLEPRPPRRPRGTYARGELSFVQCRLLHALSAASVKVTHSSPPGHTCRSGKPCQPACPSSRQSHTSLPAAAPQTNKQDKR